MKLPCALIRDLLPLYHDRVCAPESAAAVEEHLQDCEPCQELYHRLQEGDHLTLEPVEDVQQASLQKAKKHIRKKILGWTLGALLVCLTSLLCAGVSLHNTMVDMPADTLAWVHYFEKVPLSEEGSLIFANDDETGQGLHHECGAFKAVFSSRNAAHCAAAGLTYSVRPLSREGKTEWVMLMACRVSMWDAMWDSTRQSPPVMEAMGIWINSDWGFWDATCQRFVDEGLAEAPPESEKDCFVSRIYFFPQYDTLPEPDTVLTEDTLPEDAVLLWEKGAK